MEIESLYKNIENKLLKKPISTTVLLSNMRLIDDNSRQTAAYQDPSYLPFYYYLGCQIKPKHVLQLGFRLGLSASCFFKGCKDTEFFLGQQNKINGHYSFRIGKGNLLDVYQGRYRMFYGDTGSEEFAVNVNKYKWDCVLIDEEVTYDEHMSYFNMAWSNLNSSGFILIDYINFHKPGKKAYSDFCLSRGKRELVFSTRYGVGLIQR